MPIRRLMAARARTMDCGHKRGHAPSVTRPGLHMTLAVKMRVRPAADQSGFTIIEVMVAAMILAIGVLATFTMFDSANALTVDNRAREGAVNLARELTDDARAVDYDSLTSSSAQSTLQALPGLADANATQPGWQLVRRGTTFTITASACTFDSGKDGVRSVAADDGSFCPNTQAGGTPVDGNPDDFRRVEVSVVWTRAGNPSNCRGAGQSASTARNAVCVYQSGLISNPAGGLGPAIDRSSFIQAPANVVESVTASGVTLTFNTRTPADQVDWTADDSASTGTATNTDPTFKHWSLNWGGASPAPPLPTLDGNYTLAIQAFLLSVPGDVSPAVVSLNLATPLAPQLPVSPTLPGGVDSRTLNAGQDTKFVVDLNWKANAERDIVGYAVFRAIGASPAPNSDPIVCDTRQSTLTSCFDPSPLASGTSNYYVIALDQPWSALHGNPLLGSCPGVSPFNTVAVGTAVKAFDAQFNGGAIARAGCPSALIPVDITAGLANTPPTNPTNGVPSVSSAGVPHLAWTASTDSDLILFYRIYRDPSSTSPIPYAARYDRTTGPSPSYDDLQPGSTTTHRYFVTAVDTKYQESQPLEIDTP
jgi:prepilin-type N-terminal cleavage/methylation domain-containing protein